jgi:hypothetical protein
MVAGENAKDRTKNKEGNVTTRSPYIKDKSQPINGQQKVCHQMPLFFEAEVL